MWVTDVEDKNGNVITVSVLESSAGTPTRVKHYNEELEINWNNRRYYPAD